MLAVTAETLAFAGEHAGRDYLFIPVVVHINALYCHTILLMPDHLRIQRGIAAPAERKVINSIEQVCLSLAIRADETVNLWRESQISLHYILIIDYGQ